MSEDSECIRASLRAPGRFSEIFERHADSVGAFVASRVGQEAKDDILSETFLAAFRNRAKFDLAMESARPWLLGIANRMVRRHRRQEAAHWRNLVASSRLAEPVAPDELSGARDRIDAAAAVREIVPAIARLSPRDRDTLLLYAWGDLTYEQVATALNVPVGTVRSRLSRIRTRLASPPVSAMTATRGWKSEGSRNGQLEQGA